MTIENAKHFIKKELHVNFTSKSDPLKRVLYLALVNCITDEDWNNFIIPEIKEQYKLTFYQ